MDMKQFSWKIVFHENTQEQTHFTDCKRFSRPRAAGARRAVGGLRRLGRCVQTIEHSLPEEIRYLERYDRMKAAINERFDMPDHKADLLIRFLGQNKGVLSKRASEKEFKALLAAERRELEALYAEIFSEVGST